MNWRILLMFFSHARVIGAVLTLAVLLLGFVARLLWENIDYTQILLMVLSTGLTLLSYGIGRDHAVKGAKTDANS